MKKLVKWFLMTVIVAATLRRGLDAAPSKISLLSDDKAKTFPSKVPHIDDHKFPGFDVHVHDYPKTTTEAPVHDDIFLQILKYLEQTFHFIQVVDKNELLATDLVDESWYGWYKYVKHIMPFLKRINSTNIENPEHDAPGSFWDEMFVSKHSVTEVDKTDIDGDGEVENSNIHVQYTTVKFDPLGSMTNKLWNAFRQFIRLDELKRWILRVIADIIEHSVFNPHELFVTKNTTENLEKEGAGVGLGIGGVILPEGVLSILPYDPVTVGLNTILFIIYSGVFWGIYYPNSGINNLFGDYEDVVPECLEGEECPETECLEGEECPETECLEGEECPEPECPEGEECPEGAEGETADGEQAEGDAAEGDGAAQEGEAAGGAPPEGEGEIGATGDGEGGQVNRHDYYYHYGYDYQDQFVNRYGEEAKSRTHAQENNKEGLSSNYYNHGAIPFHEAYTLQDTNIYVKKRK